MGLAADLAMNLELASGDERRAARAAALEAVLRDTAQKPGLVSFAGGMPANETFPSSDLESAASAVLGGQARALALQYAWPEGDQALRAWVRERLARRGLEVNEGDVIITSGAQQALAIASDVLLDDQSVVRVDGRCYPGALELFRSRGARLTTELAGSSVAYVMPGVSNPYGDELSPDLVAEMLAGNQTILADEAYGELRFDGRAPVDLRSHARERVVLVGSVSKTLCPGLRIGWLVAPHGQGDAWLTGKKLQDLQASGLSQALLQHWLTAHDYDAHLCRVRRLYRARARHLVSALSGTFPGARFTRPEGGFSLLFDTGAQFDELAFLELATEHGVAFDPGSSFRALPRVDEPLSLRLCFANLCTDQITRGVLRLARAFEAAGLTQLFEGPAPLRAAQPARSAHAG